MLIVAGVGPGNPKYLTYEVRERIENSEVVLAFGRVAEGLKGIRKDITQVNRVDEITKHISGDKEVLLLASGDPNFFGIVEFLKKKDIEIREVLPGISSFQYLMAKLQKSWQEAKFFSLHGRDMNIIGIKDEAISILLIDKEHLPSKISKILYELGIRGKIYVGFNLSYENERLIIKNIGEEIEDISSLGVVVVENEMD